MSRNAYVNKEIPLSKIHEVKADLKRYIEFYEKITFIEDIYAGETVKYAIEKRGKTIPTGHAWLKAWNEEGFDGLLRKEGSGRKTKLSEEQFKQLKENIINKQLTSVREVKHEIIGEFGVVYSDRQIRRIMKKLGFGYGKPYIIPAEAPEDASEQLKKNTEEIDLEKDILVFADQTAVQNKDNTSRIYYELGTKNRQTKITTRIKLNANGYQAVNGNSLILFQPNTRTFEEIKSLILLRIVNCENEELKSELKNILADEELDENLIYNKLKAENTIDTLKNEFNKFIVNNNSSEKQFLVKIKNKANKLDPEKHTNIENIQKEIISKSLNNENLINDLEKEKRIVVILDNYSVHRAKLVIQASKILNIKLIHLPVHSPHLNPIEPVWKSIKKFMANYLFDTIEFMEELFEKEFYRIVNNESYYENWIKKFIHLN